jgi:hypothetical protein
VTGGEQSSTWSFQLLLRFICQRISKSAAPNKVCPSWQRVLYIIQPSLHDFPMSAEDTTYSQRRWDSHSPSFGPRRLLGPDPSNTDDLFSRNGDFELKDGMLRERCEHFECDHECGDSDGTEDSIATTTATIIHSIPQSVCSDFTAHVDCSDLTDFKSSSSSDHKMRAPGGLHDLLEPSFDMFALEDCPAPTAAAMLLQVDQLANY